MKRNLVDDVAEYVCRFDQGLVLDEEGRRVDALATQDPAESDSYREVARAILAIVWAHIDELGVRP